MARLLGSDWAIWISWGRTTMLDHRRFVLQNGFAIRNISDPPTITILHSSDSNRESSSMLLRDQLVCRVPSPTRGTTRSDGSEPSQPVGVVSIGVCRFFLFTHQPTPCFSSNRIKINVSRARIERFFHFSHATESSLMKIEYRNLIKRTTSKKWIIIVFFFNNWTGSFSTRSQSSRANISLILSCLSWRWRLEWPSESNTGQSFSGELQWQLFRRWRQRSTARTRHCRRMANLCWSGGPRHLPG